MAVSLEAVKEPAAPIPDLPASVAGLPQNAISDGQVRLDPSPLSVPKEVPGRQHANAGTQARADWVGPPTVPGNPPGDHIFQEEVTPQDPFAIISRWAQLAGDPLVKENAVKKGIVAALAAFVLLFAVMVSTAFAGEGDPQPGVGYRVIDTNCGVPAGEYGFFSTEDWWWATYSNGRGVLKCVTHLAQDQEPPATLMVVPAGSCGTPDGVTTDAFTKIFPDGKVTLICRK